MEVSKLYNVILDITNENLNTNATNLLNELTTGIAQNQAQVITNAMSRLEENLSHSVFNVYPPSNFKILIEIGAEKYVGVALLNHIKNLLTTNTFNVNQIVTDLGNFNQQRQTYLNSLSALKDNFKNLGFKPHFYRDEIYEVGVLLPAQYTHDKIATISKELQQWDKIIKSFKELLGEESADTKLSLVNNGSFEFYIQHGPTMALCFVMTLDRLAALYKKVIEIRDARTKLKSLGAPTPELNAVTKYEKELIDAEIDDIALKLIDQFASKKIADPRLNEIKIVIKDRVKYLAKSIGNGIVIEINPPELEEPDILKEPDSEENKKDKQKAQKDYEEKLARLEIIKKSLELTKEIAAAGKDVFKLLTTKNIDEQDSEE